MEALNPRSQTLGLYRRYALRSDSDECQGLSKARPDRWRWRAGSRCTNLIDLQREMSSKVIR